VPADARAVRRRGNNLSTIETVRACDLAPGVPGDRAELVRRARQVTAVERVAWLIYVEGLAHYRAGRFDEAIRHFRESRRSPRTGLASA
jgi:hypothetical protein